MCIKNIVIFPKKIIYKSIYNLFTNIFLLYLYLNLYYIRLRMSNEDKSLYKVPFVDMSILDELKPRQRRDSDKKDFSRDIMKELKDKASEYRELLREKELMDKLQYEKSSYQKRVTCLNINSSERNINPYNIKDKTKYTLKNSLSTTINSKVLTISHGSHGLETEDRISLQFSKPEYIRLDPNALSFTKGSNVVRIDYPNFKTDFPLEVYDENVLVQIKNVKAPQGTFSNFTFDSVNERVTITLNDIENTNLELNITGDESCIRVGQYISLELNEQTEDTYNILLDEDIDSKSVGDVIYKDYIVTKATDASGDSFNVKLSNSTVVKDSITRIYRCPLMSLNLENLKKDDTIIDSNGTIFKSNNYFEVDTSVLYLEGGSTAPSGTLFLRNPDYTTTVLGSFQSAYPDDINIITHVHLVNELGVTVANTLTSGKLIECSSSVYVVNSNSVSGDKTLTLRGGTNLHPSNNLDNFDQYGTSLGITSVESANIVRISKNEKLNKNKKYKVTDVNVSSEGVQTITLNVDTNLSIQSSNPRTGSWYLSEFGTYISKKEILKPHVISYTPGVDIDEDTGKDYFNINLPSGITADTTMKTGGNSMDIILMKGKVINSNAFTITKGELDIKISHANHPFFDNEDLYISGVEVMELFNVEDIETGSLTITGAITEHEAIVSKKKEYTKLKLTLPSLYNSVTDLPDTGEFIYLDGVNVIFKDDELLNRNLPYQITESDRYPLNLVVNLNNPIKDIRQPSAGSTTTKWNTLRQVSSIHNRSGSISAIEVIEGPSRKIEVSVGITGLVNITGITDISSILKINDSVIINDADIEFLDGSKLINNTSYKVIDILPKDLLNKPAHVEPSDSKYILIIDLKQNIKEIHSNRLKLSFKSLGINNKVINNQHKLTYIDKNSYKVNLDSVQKPRFSLNYFGGDNIIVGSLLFNGIPINYINADYPITKQRRKGFHRINKLDDNRYSIECDFNALSISGIYNLENIKVNKITETVEGYPMSNKYEIRLPKKYEQVTEIELISSEFPITGFSIVDGPPSKKNNAFYWQNEEDGDYIYSVEIEPGNYNTDSIRLKLKEKINKVPRINDSKTYHNFNIESESSFNKLEFTSLKATNLPNRFYTLSGVNRVYVNHPNHGLSEGDLININGSTSLGNVTSLEINKDHKIYLDINFGVSDWYYIDVNILAGTTIRKGGGTNVVVNEYINFRAILNKSDVICKRLGFVGAGSLDYPNVQFKTKVNNIDYNNIYKLYFPSINTSSYINLVDENYIYMCSSVLSNMDTVKGLIPNIFSKILMSSHPGSIIFNSFICSPKIFYDKPLGILDKIDFSFKSYSGELFDFNNINHSFSLKITENIDLIGDSQISSRTEKN